jgi:hypothetical protein
MSYFITFAPCPSDNVLCLRFANADINTTTTPHGGVWEVNHRIPVISKRLDLIASNPAASARMFRLLVLVFMELILGVSPSGKWKSTESVNSPDSHKKGLFGKIRGMIGFPETNKRLDPHLHSAVYGQAFDPHIVNRYVHSAPFREALIECINHIIQTSVDDVTRQNLRPTGDNAVQPKQPRFQSISLKSVQSGARAVLSFPADSTLELFCDLRGMAWSRPLQPASQGEVEMLPSDVVEIREKYRAMFRVMPYVKAYFGHVDECPLCLVHYETNVNQYPVCPLCQPIYLLACTLPFSSCDCLSRECHDVCDGRKRLYGTFLTDCYGHAANSANNGHTFHTFFCEAAYQTAESIRIFRRGMCVSISAGHHVCQASYCYSSSSGNICRGLYPRSACKASTKLMEIEGQYRVGDADDGCEEIVTMQAVLRAGPSAIHLYYQTLTAEAIQALMVASDLPLLATIEIAWAALNSDVQTIYTERSQQSESGSIRLPSWTCCSDTNGTPAADSLWVCRRNCFGDLIEPEGTDARIPWPADPTDRRIVVLNTHREEADSQQVACNAGFSGMFNCNTACYPYTTIGDGVGTLYYVTKYIVKNDFQLTKCLLPLSAAVTSTLQYGTSVTQAQDAANGITDKDRAFSLVCQKLINRIQDCLEVPLCIVSMRLLGHDSWYHTHAFTRCWIRSAMSYLTKNSRAKSVPSISLEEVLEEDILNEEDAAASRSTDQPQTLDGDDAVSHSRSSPGTKFTLDTGESVFVSQEEMYDNRGPILSAYNDYEYAALIRCQKIKVSSVANRGDGSGRCSRNAFQFAPGFKLRNQYVQVIASRPTIVINCGQGRPLPPSKLKPGQPITDVFAAGMQKYARYYSAYLIPWISSSSSSNSLFECLEEPRPGRVEGFDDWKLFCHIVDDMRHGRGCGSGCVWSETVQGTFSSRMSRIYRERYRTLRNYVSTTTCSADSRKVVRAWNSRGARAHPLSDEFISQASGQQDSVQEADAAMDARFVSLTSKIPSVVTSKSYYQQKSHMDSLVDRCRRGYNSTGFNSFTPLDFRMVPTHTNGLPSGCTVATLTVTHASAQADAWIKTGAEGSPTSFMEAALRQSNGLAPASFLRHDPPASSLDRNNRRRMYNYLDDVLRPDPTAFPEQARCWDYIMPQVIAGAPIRVMILGGPGSGKSTLCSRIMKRMRQLGVGISYTSAFGAAAAINNGNTIAQEFQIHRGTEKGLGESHLKTIRNNLKNISMLIVDEVSTVGVKMHTLIDSHLREALPSDNSRSMVDASYGGLPVLMVGDVQQLNPVLATSMASVVAKYAAAKALTTTEKLFINLLSKFTFFFLKANGRAKAGTTYSKAIQEIYEHRSTRRDPCPIHDRHVQHFTQKRLTAAAVATYPAVFNATILVRTNFEVWALTDARVCAYARALGVPVYYWSPKIDGSTLEDGGGVAHGGQRRTVYGYHPNLCEQMFKIHHHGGARQYFIMGARCRILHNQNVRSGM